MTRGPRRLLARAWLILRRSARDYVATAGSRDAAQVAFYVLLSFPSVLLLLVWGFAGLLDDPGIRDDIVDTIVDVLPLTDEGQAEVETLLDEIVAGAGAVGWLGAASLAYSASGAVGSLRHAVNEAWEVREDRPFLRGKALDIGLVLVVAPILILAAALYLAGWAPEVLRSRPVLASAAALLLGAVVPLLLVFALLAGLFRFLPAADVNARAALPGAAVGTAGLLLAQLGLTLYAALAAGTSSVYGVIGALLAVCVAVQAQANAVVLGAHVSAHVARLPDAAAIDAAIAEDAAEADDRSLLRKCLDLARGLVVRV